MPATFQKTIDKTLQNIKTKFAYLDDILVITKGNLQDHETEIDKILKQLNEENLAINLQKCEFAKPQITWLGFKVTPNRVTPSKPKCEAILALVPLKQHRSFMGCIHHLMKFLPNLAELSEPLRPIISKANKKAQNKLDWNEKHTEAFNQIKIQIQNITENKHFDTEKQTRVRCDASKKGLGACLEQKYGNTWKPVAYASRFLNNLEERYSTNELELLAVVWSLEHFKFYLYGSHFILQTDHQALLTALKENRGNKTYQSRLTRWVDRLLPFHFAVEHVPGKNMGFADYLSRNPSGNAPPPPPSEKDKNFVINTINETFALIKNSITPSGASEFIADKKLVNSNHVINALQNNSERNNAFCLKQLRNQSLYTSSIAFSHINPNSNLSNSKLIAITTQKNPLKETFQVPIKKRFRAPNQKLQMEQSTSTHKTSINSSTQADYTSNKGKGLDVIDKSKHEELFPSYNNTPNPRYRENLNRVFTEEFIAQASIKDLKPINDLVTTQNWEHLKKVNPVFYKISRDLSVTPPVAQFMTIGWSFPSH